VTEEDPLKRLNDLAQYLPAEDFETLKTTTLAASVTKKESDEASEAAVAAEKESAAADQAAAAATLDVDAAETLVTAATQPLSPPPAPAVIEDESAAPASIFHRGRFTAVALTVLACGMSVVF
jgi:hypothetical protein